MRLIFLLLLLLGLIAVISSEKNSKEKEKSNEPGPHSIEKKPGKDKQEEIRIEFKEKKKYKGAKRQIKRNEKNANAKKLKSQSPELKRKVEEMVEEAKQSRKKKSHKDSKGNQVVKISDHEDEMGNRHVRINQYYQGLRVEGCEAIAHDIGAGEPHLTESTKKHLKVQEIKKPEPMKYLTGNFDNDLDTELGEIDLNISDIDIQRKLVEIKQMKEQEGFVIESRGEAIELIIFIDHDDESKPKLAYQATFAAYDEEGALTRPVIVVDARTNETLQDYDSLPNGFEFITTGVGGNEKIGRDWKRLKTTADYTQTVCRFENPYVKVSDGVTDNRNAFTYDCSENQTKDVSYGQGAYSAINDALYYSTHTLRMLEKDYSFSLGYKMHVILNRNWYWNAYFWRQDTNSTEGSIYLEFDGSDTDVSNRQFYPPALASIVSHEIAHAVTMSMSRLNYHAQSGALNEAFSDMTAKYFEYFLLPEYGSDKQKSQDNWPDTDNPNHWDIGTGLIREKYNSCHDALRCMDDPTCQNREKRFCFHKSMSNVSEYDNYPPNHNNTIPNVHYSSGIFNKVFYHMARGAESLWHVYKVFIGANEFEWGPNTDFYDAAEGLLTVTDVYTSTSIVSHEVMIEAFAQVGINCSKNYTIEYPSWLYGGYIKKLNWSCDKIHKTQQNATVES